MLIINSDIAQSIRGHGAQDYPNETCGAMLGVDGEEGREVRALFPLTNRRDDSPRNRFPLPPTIFAPPSALPKSRDWTWLAGIIPIQIIRPSPANTIASMPGPGIAT